jgi:hypothetical protein
MSEIELHFLLGRLHGAKLAAAHRGELRGPLSVGFVYDDEGFVVKDPDQQVHDAVTDLFAEFHRTGSALAVMTAFDAAGRQFPQRAWGGVWAGKLKWGKLTHARVLQALKNPAYAGAYTFGRSRDVRRVQPDGSVRTTRRKLAREDWTVTIQDHHEGYITWQEYLDIEAKLAANNTKQGARPVREGTALCQGIILCGVCGGRVGTKYERRDKKVSYTCEIKDSQRTQQCRSVVASTIDAAVSALFLDTITPDQIAVAVAAADEVTERHASTHRAAQLAVERARYEADRAERSFINVEPENRLVARTLETRWETKLAALTEAQAALATAKAAKPPPPERTALQALAADLPRLWDSPTTSHRDRKRLLRPDRRRHAAARDRPGDGTHRRALAHRRHRRAHRQPTRPRTDLRRRTGPGPPLRSDPHQRTVGRQTQRRRPDHRQRQAVYHRRGRPRPRRLQDLGPTHRRRPSRRSQRQTRRHRARHPRRRHLQLAQPRTGTRPSGQRTLVHPLGRCDPGDLPAESRKLVQAEANPAHDRHPLGETLTVQIRLSLWDQTFEVTP